MPLPCPVPCEPPACSMRKLMHRVTFPWELKMVNTTDDCPDAGALRAVVGPCLLRWQCMPVHRAAWHAVLTSSLLSALRRLGL